MKFRTLLFYTLLLSFFFGIQFCEQAKGQQAKRVILMIGDGMGFNSDLAGTYWRFGKENAQSYHQFPKHLACTTFSLTRDIKDITNVKGYNSEVFWSHINGGHQGTKSTQTTDSAASATAINSGRKTLNGRLGMTYSANPVEQYAVKVAESGRSVGIVTTVTMPHATPGAVMAHLPSRNMYEAIARELILDQPVSVLFGGGHPKYNQAVVTNKRDYKFVGGKYVWHELKKKGDFADAKFIDEKAEFEELAQLTPDKKSKLPKRVVGIAQTKYIAPVDGAVDEKSIKTLKELYSPAEIEKLPSLSTMAVAALNILSQNDQGFYLMIEGGAIDSANHGRNIKRMCMEHAGFSKAIDAVCQWIDKYASWDDTLLIITADHETGQIWGPETYDDTNKDGIWNSGEKFNGHKRIINNGKGEFPSVQYGSGGHTNALVPVWIKGAGCNLIDSFVRGNDAKAAQFWKFSGDYIDNTDITPFMKKASGISDK